MPKLCKYKSATACGYLEKNLKPCDACAFGAEPTAAKGERGEQGPPGPPVEKEALLALIKELIATIPTKQGEKGEKGDTVIGPPGLTGAPGPAGQDGFSVKGEQGPPGPPGAPAEIDEEKWFKELLRRLEPQRNVLLGWGARTIAHASTTGKTTSDHHTKYTDAEAVEAVETTADIDHDARLVNVLPDQHHDEGHLHASHPGDENSHHDELHTVASHSDTTATGTQLDKVTDGSEVDLEHTHKLMTYITIGSESGDGISFTV